MQSQIKYSAVSGDVREIGREICFTMEDAHVKRVECEVAFSGFFVDE